MEHTDESYFNKKLHLVLYVGKIEDTFDKDKTLLPRHRKFQQVIMDA